MSINLNLLIEGQCEIQPIYFKRKSTTTNGYSRKEKNTGYDKLGSTYHCSLKKNEILNYLA